MLSVDALVREDSLRDKALRILRQAIISGAIEPGQIYSATALAKRLGVSVSPVREAMLTLVHEGTLESLRNRGFRVTQLDPEDLDEIFELRSMLEVPVAAAIAKTDLSTHEARLTQLVSETETSAKARDVNSFLDADRTFHLALHEIHGNRRLTSWVANLRDQTRLYGLHAPAVDTLTAAAAEHRAILDHLMSGDASAVRRTMKAHLAHIRSDWSAKLPSDPPVAP